MASPVNPLLTRLLAIHRGEPDVVPKGHKTSIQWAKEWGVTRLKAQLLLRAGMEKKLIKQIKHRIQSGKVLRQIVHYYEA